MANSAPKARGERAIFQISPKLVSLRDVCLSFVPPYFSSFSFFFLAVKKFTTLSSHCFHQLLPLLFLSLFQNSPPFNWFSEGSRVLSLAVSLFFLFFTKKLSHPISISKSPSKASSSIGGRLLLYLLFHIFLCFHHLFSFPYFFLCFPLCFLLVSPLFFPFPFFVTCFPCVFLCFSFFPPCYFPCDSKFSHIFICFPYFPVCSPLLPPFFTCCPMFSHCFHSSSCFPPCFSLFLHLSPFVPFSSFSHFFNVSPFFSLFPFLLFPLFAHFSRFPIVFLVFPFCHFPRFFLFPFFHFFTFSPLSAKGHRRPSFGLTGFDPAG